MATNTTTTRTAEDQAALSEGLPLSAADQAKAKFLADAEATWNAQQLTGSVTDEPSEPTLCNVCVKKLTPTGIEWQELCPTCFDAFVEKPKA